ELSAGPQQAADLRRIIASVTVQNQIESPIGKGQKPPAIRLLKPYPQRGEPPAAEFRVGCPALGGAGLSIGMPRSQQEPPAAGVHIKRLCIRPQERSNHLLIVPRQVLLLLIAPAQMGKIPAFHLRRTLFLQPLAIQLRSVHSKPLLFVFVCTIWCSS